MQVFIFVRFTYSILLGLLVTARIPVGISGQQYFRSRPLDRVYLLLRGQLLGTVNRCSGWPQKLQFASGSGNPAGRLRIYDALWSESISISEARDGSRRHPCSHHMKNRRPWINNGLSQPAWPLRMHDDLSGSHRRTP